MFAVELLISYHSTFHKENCYDMCLKIIHFISPFTAKNKKAKITTEKWKKKIETESKRHVATSDFSARSASFHSAVCIFAGLSRTSCCWCLPSTTSCILIRCGKCRCVWHKKKCVFYFLTNDSCELPFAFSFIALLFYYVAD